MAGKRKIPHKGRHKMRRKGGRKVRRGASRNGLFPSTIRGRGGWLVASLTVSIMGIAMLAASFSLALGEAAKEWQEQLRGRYTLEIPHHQDEQLFGHGDASAESREAYALEVVRFLTESGEVKTITEVPEENLRALVEPWLGTLPPTIGLPKFYEVTPDDATQGLSNKLVASLAEIAPTVRLEQYATWSDPLLETAANLRLISGGAFVLAVVAFVLMILLTVRATLVGDRATVRLLRQMGATDRFIGREVSRFAMRTGGFGAVGGLVLIAPPAPAPTKYFEWATGRIPRLASVAFTCRLANGGRSGRTGCSPSLGTLAPKT